MMKAPPVRVVQAANAARMMLQAVARRMVPPEVALLELNSGFMATQAVYAAARLGVAEALASGPLSADAVSAEVGSPPDITHRLLRARGLRDLPRRVDRTLRADQHGDADHEFATTFDSAMTRLSALDGPAVDAAYAFTTFSTIVDIGGGNGQLLAPILQEAPSARGVLLERPARVRKAEEHLRDAGVLSRCRIESGSFVETAPSDGDLYLMRRVIHDFSDEQAAAILTTVRDDQPNGATLLCRRAWSRRATLDTSPSPSTST